jgi:5-methyltetrahydrofolate--homocysteine methyltransferase
LLGGNKEEYVEDLLEEYDELREDYYAGLEERYFLDFDKAKKAKLEI